jgi:hypothetical protein
MVQYRNLSQNEFGGGIDLSFNTSASLALLDLSDNKFTGPLPNLSGWFNLQAL